MNNKDNEITFLEYLTFFFQLSIGIFLIYSIYMISSNFHEIFFNYYRINMSCYAPNDDIFVRIYKSRDFAKSSLGLKKYFRFYSDKINFGSTEISIKPDKYIENGVNISFIGGEFVLIGIEGFYFFNRYDYQTSNPPKYIYFKCVEMKKEPPVIRINQSL